MRFTRFTCLIAAATLLTSVRGLAQGKPFEPAPNAQIKTRELSAPAAIKSRLDALRAEIKSKGLSFEVGYTTAMDLPPEQLTGLAAGRRGRPRPGPGGADGQDAE